MNPISTDKLEANEALRLVSTIQFKSADRDNMEFTARVSCYQRDALTSLITELIASRSTNEDLRRERDEAVRSKEHTQYWYAVRLERLKDLAKERGIWTEVAAIIANGTLTAVEPPTYAQQLNIYKYRAEAAEREPAIVKEGGKP
jgi:hypothetical protein